MRRLRPRIAFLAAVALGGAAPAEPQIDVSSMTFLSGHCERLTFAGRDLSGECRGTLVNIAYRSGRTSFAFSGDGMMLSSSGIGEPIGDRDGALVLDLVTLAAHGTATNVDVAPEAATGRCEYSNPYGGAASIRCAATFRSGEARAVFTTDGGTPERRDF